MTQTQLPKCSTRSGEQPGSSTRRGSRQGPPAIGGRQPIRSIAAAGAAAPFGYFFFSLWSVCLRSRGEYFLILSFSPPLLRRRV